MTVLLVILVVCFAWTAGHWYGKYAGLLRADSQPPYQMPPSLPPRRTDPLVVEVIERPAPVMYVEDDSGRVWEVSYQKMGRPVRSGVIQIQNFGPPLLDPYVVGRKPGGGWENVREGPLPQANPLAGWVALDSRWIDQSQEEILRQHPDYRYDHDRGLWYYRMQS